MPLSRPIRSAITVAGIVRVSRSGPGRPQGRPITPHSGTQSAKTAPKEHPPTLADRGETFNLKLRWRRHPGPRRCTERASHRTGSTHAAQLP